jgi:hypothetical protein
MPEISPDIKNWHRGGRLNQKRHLEMTEEEKKHIAHCEGIKNGHPCKKPIYRCTNCGNYGCDYEVVDKCPEQGFKNDKCLHCGEIGIRVPVMEEELEQVRMEWDKSYVPKVGE